MQKNWFLLMVFALTTLSACGIGRKKEQQVAETSWGQKMSETVVNRNPHLYAYNSKHESVKWAYDVAMLGQAVDLFGPIDKKYSIYNVDYYNHFVDSVGVIMGYKKTDFNIDNLNPGNELIELYKQTKEERYLKAINQLVDQLENQPRTPEGGFWHKKIYPNQMWLDGIYMGCPFMVRYAKEFNQPKWYDEATKQITLIYSKTKDPVTGLCFHAWDESKTQQWCNPETGLSKHFWGRSMGWYVMALVDVLEILPAEHPQRAELVTILNDVSAALVKVQDPKMKLWYQVLDQAGREGNYLEMSGSSMYIYAFAKGAKLGVLPESYRKVAEESFDSMVKNFIRKDADGFYSLTNICAAAGLGGKPYRDGSYEYYINERKQDNDCKGVAPFIMASTQLGK